MIPGFFERFMTLEVQSLVVFVQTLEDERRWLILSLLLKQGGVRENVGVFGQDTWQPGCKFGRGEG